MLPLLDHALDEEGAAPSTTTSSSPTPPVGPSLTIEVHKSWVVEESDDDEVLLRRGAASLRAERLAGECSTALSDAIEDAQEEDPSVPDEPGEPHTAGKVVGELRTWFGPTTEGQLFTACHREVPVVVLARGPEGSLTAAVIDEVGQMLLTLEVT